MTFNLLSREFLRVKNSLTVMTEASLKTERNFFQNNRKIIIENLFTHLHQLKELELIELSSGKDEILGLPWIITKHLSR